MGLPAHRRGVVLIALVVLAVVLAAVVWRVLLRDFVVPRRLGVVIPGVLYRSAQLEGNLVDDVLAHRRVRTVLNLGVYKPGKADHDATVAACNLQGIRVRTFGLGGDGRGDHLRYVDILDEMKQARDRREPLLVHCSAGVNRTGAAVALYRVLIEGVATDAALREMRAFDFDPHDNTELLPFLNRHIDEIAAGLVDRQVIAQLPDPMPRFPIP